MKIYVKAAVTFSDDQVTLNGEPVAIQQGRVSLGWLISTTRWAFNTLNFSRWIISVRLDSWPLRC